MVLSSSNICTIKILTSEGDVFVTQMMSSEITLYSLHVTVTNNNKLCLPMGLFFCLTRGCNG